MSESIRQIRETNAQIAAGYAKADADSLRKRIADLEAENARLQEGWNRYVAGVKVAGELKIELIALEVRIKELLAERNEAERQAASLLIDRDGYKALAERLEKRLRRRSQDWHDALVHEGEWPGCDILSCSADKDALAARID